jgi:hypothetical protein
MKIFFATSSQFYLENKERFETIKRTIKEVSGGVLLSMTDKKLDGIKTEKEVVTLIQSGQSALKDSDVVIAVSDLGSAGLGYDIAKAIDMKKPVLIISEEGDQSKKTPHPIRINSKLLTYRSYKNHDDLKKVIKEFISDSKNKLDTKFILIISPEIDRYLEWASEFRRMHKAQVVRESVEAVMKKDKEYRGLLG